MRPFGHRAALQPHHRKGSNARPVGSIDRTLELHQRAHRKAGIGEPLVRRRRIGNRERSKMHAGMARQRGVEFAAERRVGGLEQHLDVAAREHRGDVAGAGRRAVGIGLHRHRRRRETGARQRRARRLRVGDEMADVIEEDFAADRKLAVGLVRHLGSGHAEGSVLTGVLLAY